MFHDRDERSMSEHTFVTTSEIPDVSSQQHMLFCSQPETYAVEASTRSVTDI